MHVVAGFFYQRFTKTPTPELLSTVLMTLMQRTNRYPIAVICDR